ncbi:TPA: hypothetical protein ACQYC6_004141 [Vibrio parahaemolyticus]
MYIIGTIVYMVVIFSYYFIGAMTEMINEALVLAPEITYAMLFLYFAPLVIHLYQIVTKKNTTKDLSLIDKQTKLAASVSVSLGLIGTFQGLTAMVSAIAGSLGGDGDMMEKINTMMESISSALAAMSYAFLTSILGVAISVLLLISLNFWGNFYKNKTQSGVEKTSSELNDIYKQLQLLSEVTIELNEKVIVLSSNEEKSTVAITTLSQIASSLHSMLDFLKDSEFRNLEIQSQIVEKVIDVSSLLKSFEDGLFLHLSRSQESLINVISDGNANVDAKLSSVIKINNDICVNISNTNDELSKLHTGLGNQVSALHEDIKNGYMELRQDKHHTKNRIKRALEIFYES